MHIKAQLLANVTVQKLTHSYQMELVLQQLLLQSSEAVIKIISDKNTIKLLSLDVCCHKVSRQIIQLVE